MTEKLFFRWRWKVSEFKITIEGDHIISCLGKGHLGTTRTVGKDDKQPPSINSMQLFITKEEGSLPVEKPSRHQCHSKWAVLVLFTSCEAFWRHHSISTSLQGAITRPVGLNLGDVAEYLGIWERMHGPGSLKRDRVWVSVSMIGRCTPPGRCLKL